MVHINKKKPTFVYTTKSVTFVSTNKADVGMKIEEIIRTTTILNNSKRIILNVLTKHQ
jgi:hypothetical protein